MSALDKFEAQIRREAQAFALKSKYDEPQTPLLFNKIYCLTGISIETQDDFQKAIAVIERKLCGQRRMGKTHHPRYDMNKHMYLKTLLDELTNMEMNSHGVESALIL